MRIIILVAIIFVASFTIKEKCMSTKMELSKLYEMILSLPGMNEDIKVSLKVSRKNILFLSELTEKSLAEKGTGDKLTGDEDFITAQARQELQQIIIELLQKAGLTEARQKLQHFYNMPSS